MARIALMSAAFGLTLGSAAPIATAWQPSKPVEVIVTAGAGGGTDIFPRTVQSIIIKYNLMPS